MEAADPAPARPLLEVSNLHVRLGHPPIKAVRGIGFDLGKGEMLGLAGESGSGKSVTAFALTRLLPPDAYARYEGSVRLQGTEENLLTTKRKTLRKIRQRRLRYIFQEPSASFHPLFTIGKQLEEVLRMSSRLSPRQARKEAEAALSEVGIDPKPAVFNAFPSMFSGGMLQRLAIACALCGEPEILVADEPTTALDTTTQKRIIGLLQDLNQRRGLATLFISHDLSLLYQICDRLLVMQEGRIVESGPAGEVLRRPAHPYTRQLVDAIPRLRTG